MHSDLARPLFGTHPWLTAVLKALLCPVSPRMPPGSALDLPQAALLAQSSHSYQSCTVEEPWQTWPGSHLRQCVRFPWSSGVHVPCPSSRIRQRPWCGEATITHESASHGLDSCEVGGGGICIPHGKMGCKSATTQSRPTSHRHPLVSPDYSEKGTSGGSMHLSRSCAHFTFRPWLHDGRSPTASPCMLDHYSAPAIGLAPPSTTVMHPTYGFVSLTSPRLLLFSVNRLDAGEIAGSGSIERAEFSWTPAPARKA